ncbi:MAG: hypothetical protein methR_P2454 [Methyloprofundus sp.]|nr:MAG: hypothetical protein methR_P2454 [Methyloprofundus sp.]
MTDDELKELVASLAIAQRETDAQIKLTSEQMKLTDEQMKRTDAKLERMGIMLGNISANQGDVAEDFFYQSLIKDNRLGPITFDEITKNMGMHKGNVQEEYDLIMANGDAVAIVEVKYRAHVNDVKKLERKFHNFKKLFPIYKDYKLYGALAAFHMNDDAKKEVLRKGYFALQRTGDVICSENSEYLQVL